VAVDRLIVFVCFNELSGVRDVRHPVLSQCLNVAKPLVTVSESAFECIGVHMSGAEVFQQVLSLDKPLSAANE
jgi:hypothetical protein